MTIGTILYWIYWILGYTWCIGMTFIGMRLAFYNLRSFIKGYIRAIKRYDIKSINDISLSTIRLTFRAAIKYARRRDFYDLMRAFNFSFLYPSSWRAAYNRLINKKNK